jgi:hypothetical protein
MQTPFIGAVVGAVVLLAGVSAQDVRLTPGPGTGIVTVRGTVEVANLVNVRPIQEADWRVAVTNVPEVRITNTAAVDLAGTSFVTRGRRYDIMWTSGERETVTIVDVGQSGWVQVGSARDARKRWLNLTNARAVEEAM